MSLRKLLPFTSGLTRTARLAASNPSLAALAPPLYEHRSDTFRTTKHVSRRNIVSPVIAERNIWSYARIYFEKTFTTGFRAFLFLPFLSSPIDAFPTVGK